MRWRGATALAAVSGVVLLGVLGVVVLALLLVDRVTVRTAGDLGSVHLGLPCAWVHQEQGVDPPLPWRAGLLSPWEHPTTLSVLPLLADLVLVGAVVVAAWWLGRRGVRRLQERKRAAVSSDRATSRR